MVRLAFASIILLAVCLTLWWAFQTTNGSVVVRKDWKVLLVNSTGLPPQFGQPPTSSGDVAVTVSDVILGCWAGD